MSIGPRLALRVLPALLAGAVVSAGQVPPAAEMRTLTYASRDGAELELDLYLPASPIRRPAPVIVFLHGGGWSGGTRTTGPDFSRYFARDGFAMASIYDALKGAGHEVTLRLVDGLPHTFFNRTDLDDVAGPFQMQAREYPRGGPEVRRVERGGVFAVAGEFFLRHLR